jgi:hypothetical protein
MRNKKISEDIIHQAKKRTNIKQKELKWFEKCMDEGVFELKTGKDNNFYLHYNEWKEKVWIGPYKTEDEANKVVASYIKETKKPFGKRKEIKNIHSIIIEKEDFWKA